MAHGGSKGFTLLEMVVVIGIIGFLAVIAQLAWDVIDRERASSITRELLVDIQRARIDAITQRGKGVGIRFESAKSYILFEFNDCNDDYDYDENTCNGSREETEIMRKTIPSPFSLHKTSLSNNLDNEILIFDKFGHPRQKNWGIGLMTILVSRESDLQLVKCIAISTNRVRQKIWNGTACI